MKEIIIYNKKDFIPFYNLSLTIKGFMDKQIKKVEKDIVKGNKKKGKKDVKKLLKMDKKYDKDLKKCGYKGKM